jgi:hypothetical protein
MQNLQEIAEQAVRMEGRILVKLRQFHITAIDLVIAERLQLTVAMIFGE